jgi:sugar-specific transcriptional regulator TrmB
MDTDRLISQIQERFEEFNEEVEGESPHSSDNTDGEDDINEILTRTVLKSKIKEACYILTGFSQANFDVLFQIAKDVIITSHLGRSKHLSPKDSLLLFLAFIRNYPTLDVMALQFSVNRNPLNNTLRNVLSTCHFLLLIKFSKK